MEAKVVHFRQSRHRVKPKQTILKVGDTAEEASQLIGKTATWTSPAGKTLQGKIVALHGRRGCVRTHFTEKGLPGQALGQKVKVE